MTGLPIEFADADIADVPAPRPWVSRAVVQRIARPMIVMLLALGIWQFVVWYEEVPVYLVPGPLQIAQTLIADWATLSGSLAVTLSISLAALAMAAVLGAALAILFAQSKWIEEAFFPFAVVMQVTPIVAVAPLIIIWVNDTKLSLLICAWLVAFFPILSNTTFGSEFGRSQFARPVPPLSRFAPAHALAAEDTRGDAVFPRGAADLRGPVADRSRRG